MKASYSVRTLAALASAAVLTLGASSAAHAHDGGNIYWSIGMSSPGVSVGVASAPPMVMYPPVYVVPRPVYYLPPAPVVYGPPGWYRHDNGWHRGWHGRGHDHGRFEHGREGRWGDRD